MIKLHLRSFLLCSCHKLFSPFSSQTWKTLYFTFEYFILENSKFLPYFQICHAKTLNDQSTAGSGQHISIQPRNTLIKIEAFSYLDCGCYCWTFMIFQEITVTLDDMLWMFWGIHHVSPPKWHKMRLGKQYMRTSCSQTPFSYSWANLLVSSYLLSEHT